MEVPLGRKRYQHRAERVQDSKGDGHDDAVHEERVNRALRPRGGVRVPRPNGAIVPGAAIVPVPGALNKGVGILRDERPREVETELVTPLMLRDARVGAPRVQRVALPPRSDPGRRLSAEVHVAAVPALAV